MGIVLEIKMLQYFRDQTDVRKCIQRGVKHIKPQVRERSSVTDVSKEMNRKDTLNTCADPNMSTLLKM